VEAPFNFLKFFPTILYHGDKREAQKRWRYGVAAFQALSNLMKFRKLKQHKLQKIYSDGMVVTAHKFFNEGIVHIFVPVVEIEKVEEIQKVYGALVYIRMSVDLGATNTEPMCGVYDHGLKEFAKNIPLNDGSGMASFPCDPDLITDWLAGNSIDNGATYLGATENIKDQNNGAWSPGDTCGGSCIGVGDVECSFSGSRSASYLDPITHTWLPTEDLHSHNCLYNSTASGWMSSYRCCKRYPTDCSSISGDGEKLTNYYNDNRVEFNKHRVYWTALKSAPFNPYYWGLQHLPYGWLGKFDGDPGVSSCADEHRVTQFKDTEDNQYMSTSFFDTPICRRTEIGPPVDPAWIVLSRWGDSSVELIQDQYSVTVYTPLGEYTFPALYHDKYESYSIEWQQAWSYPPLTLTEDTESVTGTKLRHTWDYSIFPSFPYSRYFDQDPLYGYTGSVAAEDLQKQCVTQIWIFPKFRIRELKWIADVNADPLTYPWHTSPDEETTTDYEYDVRAGISFVDDISEFDIRTQGRDADYEQALKAVANATTDSVDESELGEHNSLSISVSNIIIG